MRNNIVAAFIVFVALLVMSQVYSDFKTLSDTKVVTISTNDPNSVISVVDHSRQAVVGKGGVKTRLPKSSYVVIAVDGSKEASKTVSVTNSSPLSIHLGLTPINTQVFANNAVAANNIALLKLLPFIGPGLDFEINYSFSGTNNSLLVINITAPTPQDQQYALAWLSSVGINTSLYDYNFVTAPVTP